TIRACSDAALPAPQLVGLAPLQPADLDLIDAQGGVLRQRPLALEAGPGVGGMGSLVDLLVLRVADDDGERSVGEVGGVGLVVLRMADPGLELDLVFGAIDRPIGDREDAGGVVLGVVDAVVPPPGEAEVAEPIAAILAVLRLVGGDQPVVVGGLIALTQDELAVGIGGAGEAGGIDAPAVVPEMDLMPAEELEV